MRSTGLASLKLLILSLSVLALGSCASVDTAIDNTMLASDIAMDNAEDAIDTASRVPMKSEDYIKGTCPSVKLVDELGVLHDFADFRSPSESNLITRVKVGKLSSTCSYTDRSVTVDINLIFEGLLGPAAQRGMNDTFFSYPFFVAITSPSNVIMAREIFAAPMSYGPGQTQQVHHENMRQIIPIARESDGPGYNILIGFQLNKAQLGYNRDVQKTQRKMAQKNAKARKLAEKNKPPTMPLREDVIRQQSGGTYYAPVVQPTVRVAPVSPVTSQPLNR